jgi:hypothetical protein
MKENNKKNRARKTEQKQNNNNSSKQSKGEEYRWIRVMKVFLNMNSLFVSSED